MTELHNVANYKYSDFCTVEQDFSAEVAVFTHTHVDSFASSQNFQQLHEFCTGDLFT